MSDKNKNSNKFKQFSNNLCYRAALIVAFQLLGFFFPAQLDPEPDNKNCPSMVQTQQGLSQPLATPDPHQS